MGKPKIYLITLGISLFTFILEVFLFKFSGAFGLIICIFSLYLIVGTIIRLIKLSDLIKSDIFEKIDILFF